MTEHSGDLSCQDQKHLIVQLPKGSVHLFHHDIETIKKTIYMSECRNQNMCCSNEGLQHFLSYPELLH